MTHLVKQHYDGLGMKLRSVAAAMRLEDESVKTCEADYLLARTGSGGGEGVALLEVGCGYGRLVPALLARGVRYTGVDISETYVEECRRRFPSAGCFVSGDFAQLAPAALGVQDVVAFPWLVLSHFDFDVQAQMIARACSLLRAGPASYVVFDHVPTEAVDLGVDSVGTTECGDVIVPRGKRDTGHRCYVMSESFMQRIARDNGLQLEIADMRVTSVSKQYVYLSR